MIRVDNFKGELIKDTSLWDKLTPEKEYYDLHLPDGKGGIVVYKGIEVIDVNIGQHVEVGEDDA